VTGSELCPGFVLNNANLQVLLPISKVETVQRNIRSHSSADTSMRVYPKVSKLS